MGHARTRMYRKGVLEADDFPVDQVSECLEVPDTVVWVDICSPTGDQLHQLADELGLHELAVEDAAELQRPKLDRYASHLFLSCPTVRVDRDTGELEEMKIDAFISPHWLITVRQDERFSIDAVLRRWDRSPDLAVHGVSFLVYGLLDVVVDDYFDVVQTFDEFYDEIADGIFAERPIDPAKHRHWFQMRRALVRLHRLVVPMREAISSLMHRETDVVSGDLYPYYQDVYDHILRVGESTDSLRDLVSTIVETNLSLRDYRQNQVVKRVTSWAAIIAVPTLITGYYGMNVPYPTSGEPVGWVVATVLMVAVSAILYYLFKRAGWM